MNLQQSPTSTVERPGARNGSETRLHGRWLVLARVGWIAVTMTLVILNLIALPDTYGAHFTFTPQVLQDLHRLGLSPTLYSILLTVENAPFQLVYLALGLLLFLRRSDDRMALFCAFALVTFGNALPFYDFTNGSLVPSLATNAVLRVVALVLFAIGEASLVLFFYLFPSGRFAPRWTRWGALLVAAYWLAVIFFPALPSNAGGPATFLVPFFLLTAAVAQVYRYRRVSTPRERQQTKWVVFGLALAMLVLVVYIPIGFLLPPSIQNDPVLGNLNPVFEVALLLIAIFLAIAVLRSRLWDIDTLINRTLVYGLLTTLLAALYAGLIIGLESLAGVITRQGSQQPVVLVVSTLAIFALFQPLRRRIQNIIDRRFYRRKYDAAKTLAAFSAMLRNEVDLNQLRAQLLAVVQETMQPAHVSLWLRPPDRTENIRQSAILRRNKVDPLNRLRTICLAFPEAIEAGGVGDPTFKVRDKIFAMRHQVDGRMSMWCKAPPGAQNVLVGSNPEQFFVPPYVGHHGWVGVWLDVEIDWDLVADLIHDSYRMTAPKRLSARLDES